MATCRARGGSLGSLATVVTWVNNHSGAYQRVDQCGEVDAAPFMPKDLFEPSHKLALLAYVEATVSLFGMPSGPHPGDLKLGRCKDHG